MQPLRKYDSKPNEPLRLYIFRYSKIHKLVTKRDACYDTDPSRWFRFLTSIMNTTIADKITRSESLPQNLQQCFEKALRLEASIQLSEGVKMAGRTIVMNINLEGREEINLVRDARAKSNACYKCSEWDISKEIASRMEISPLTTNRPKVDNHPWTPMILW